MTTNPRILKMKFSSVYPLYLAKIEKKNRTKPELDQVIIWLTGLDQEALANFIVSEATFLEFFQACTLNPKSDTITGSICGVKVQEIQDPLMKQIRLLDKVVDELARGWSLAKIRREK
ncbi:DUF2200 domain-containing protein [Pseudolactococcus yaeyamensis]